MRGVHSVLGPLTSGALAATKKPKDTNEVFNTFEHHDVEETPAAFKQSPDVTQAPAPVYKARRPNDIEGDFFTLHRLLHDFARLRIEVSHA